MSKRKLTPRQTERVREHHQQRLTRSATRSAARATSEDDLADLGPEQPGVVIANFGASLEIEETHGNIILCNTRQNLGDVFCGDDIAWRAGSGDGRNAGGRALHEGPRHEGRDPAPDAARQDIVWRAGSGSGVVVAVRPRRSLLARSDAYGQVKPVAANVDLMVVVIAPLPAVSEHLLDGYLVAAELYTVRPLIVVNKGDLLDAPARSAFEQRMEVYRRIGYDVVFVSTRQGEGLEQVRTRLAQHTSVVVGHSGVGKSSLLKTLLPDIDIAIGDVSVTGLGKHTTTTTRLYHFGDHARLIDSPGVRDFKLGHISVEEAAQGFAEFRPYLGQCKFTDCRHTVEPACAIRAAHQAGHIAPARYASYQRFLEALRTGNA